MKTASLLCDDGFFPSDMKISYFFNDAFEKIYSGI